MLADRNFHAGKALMDNGEQRMQFLRGAQFRRQSNPFDDPDWLFELKLGGCRALALVAKGKVSLVSRTGASLNGFGPLAQQIARSLPVTDAILDGEIAVPGKAGRTIWTQCRREAQFYAFDLLWLNGQDLRATPLLTRKERLKMLIGKPSLRLGIVPYVVEHGTVLYGLACEKNLAGITAKRADHPYPQDDQKALWVAIKNPCYNHKR